MVQKFKHFLFQNTTYLWLTFSVIFPFLHLKNHQSTFMKLPISSNDTAQWKIWTNYGYNKDTSQSKNEDASEASIRVQFISREYKYFWCCLFSLKQKREGGWRPTKQIESSFSIFCYHHFWVSHFADFGPKEAKIEIFSHWRSYCQVQMH